MDFSNHPLNHNVNVNVGNKLLNNVNVTHTAQKLSDSLDDHHSYRFFCKVARTLPEHVVWSTLEEALSKRKPAAYFTTVCKILMDTQHA